MSNIFADLDNVTRQIKSMERKKKPKMLVVDDEPDNLDLLYRTFRRDFRVFKADSGVSALDVLKQEGEVAVIISDQRMPEMKGTEFLSKTVPDFPDTVRIILTGFTDVEDLVEAINSGQVYKYITKPWDPNELKVVVERAAETYDLLKQRTDELKRAHEQATLLSAIAQVAQEFTSPDDCLPPLAKAFNQSFSADGCILQKVSNGQLGLQGKYAPQGDPPITLENDPLVAEVLRSQQSQVWLATAGSPPEGAEQYTSTGVQVHLVFPLIYRGKMLALLSLQWTTSAKPDENEIKLIHLATQQAVLALTAVQVNG
ncbi:response regulator [Spirulina subsalsa]|uniref:response regulator n=1 Tax=Spirulina subsalsa TaxID=54311 RepID=UPI0002EE6A7F|nr:response regulator [Spirulina subsalsa]